MARNYTVSILRLLAALLLLVFVATLWGNTEVAEDVSAQVRFAGDHDFLVQDNGLAALQRTYDFHFDLVHDLLIGLTHEALGAEDVDAALGYATDGKIVQLDLVRLEDNRNFFPAFSAGLIVREEVLEEYPQIADVMNRISDMLDTETMAYLNYMVSIEDQDMRTIAEVWLAENQLLPDGEISTGPGATIRVGANEFSEHQILGQITLAALEGHGIPVADHTQPRLFDLASESILRAGIDLYWECSGRQWDSFFDSEIHLLDGEVAYALVAEQDRVRGLIWLEPASFTTSRAILMRRSLAEELGIRSISDLAAWVRDVQKTPQ